MISFRSIPSIDLLLNTRVMTSLVARHGRDAVTRAAREATATLRDAIARHDPAAPASESAAVAWLEARVEHDLSAATTMGLRKVINATGVLLHTNLGRAPLAARAGERANELSRGYLNLEYDLDEGTRGARESHCDALLRHLTGAESSLVVNNNAAAALLSLSALASGREVIVSRGELVEIGGGFRVPEVMTQSGANLREVGTTNRTRVSDYAAAIGDRTAAILRVHPSNFRVEGFVERPKLDELVALTRQFNLPLIEDLGSGWLSDREEIPALHEEPSVAASVRAGVDLVTFSGDKLLGGPQAGVLVGRAELMGRLRKHPLMRAIRPDKLTLGALAETLAMWSEPARRTEIPIYRMLTMSAHEIDRRARAIVAQLGNVVGVTIDVIDGSSTIGGGSAPGSTLPTRLVAVSGRQQSSTSDVEDKLRHFDPPIVGRIENDRVVLDLRTVDPADDALVVKALAALKDAGD